MTNQRLDVTCVGILVADLFASPLPELPAAGELRVVDDIFLATGGCAANTGVSLTKLGAKVGLIGKVGDDAFGPFIRQDMLAKGLDPSGIRVSPEHGTSKTMIITVIGQDRRFIHTVGANADLSYDDIDLDMVARSQALYVGGYLVLPKLDQPSLNRLFDFARERGIMTALDVVVPAGRDKPYHIEATIAQVLPFTDVFLPNEDEARLLTGLNDVEAQADLFLRYGCKVVVITMGEHGAFVRTQEEALRAPTFPVEVVDPSGAGDAFDAGFIMGLLQGWDLPRTLQFASAIGASACMKLGCTSGVFTMVEAEEFLKAHKLDIRKL